MKFTDIEYVVSCRGNPMIIFEGVNFTKERSRGVVTRWVCGRKRRLQCNASLTTVDGVVVKTYGTHNHS
ncbi:unnamed protein product [Parnassius mnemosyne]|uniref:FLYWCH-type domain-containing protein n=1 Tax=Parnassius mnemosyne TaxID=213953 RepID=A0AAV1KBD9_9NEOP